MVEGVLNLRGEIIALLNLRRRCGLPDRPLALTDHFVVAWEGTRWVALRVDRVVNLQRLPIKKTADAGRYISGSDVISGVATSPDGIVLIHDLGRFLSPGERDFLSSRVTPSTTDSPSSEPTSLTQETLTGALR